MCLCSPCAALANYELRNLIIPFMNLIVNIIRKSVMHAYINNNVYVCEAMYLSLYSPKYPKTPVNQSQINILGSVNVSVFVTNYY